MNNRIFALIFSSLLGFVLFIATAQGESRKGWVVHDTQIPYSSMVKKLNKAIRGEKMLIVSRASASMGAKRRDIQIPGNMVVGVYRNDFAVRMLAASVEAGIEAPIRFYITERRDGSARLSYKTPSFVFEPYLAQAEPELKTMAAELDGIFATIATNAIKP